MKMFATAVLLATTAAVTLAAENKPLRARDVSFQHEVQRAIERGVDYLNSSQNSNGWWSTPDHPSVTALALSAIMAEPNPRLKKSPAVSRGYKFVLECVKPDGGIYVTNLANYNTSISMMALLAANEPKYDGVLRKARNYVVGSQVDTGEPGKADSPFDGGIGYSNQEGRSDMNNTLVALEAIYHSKHLVEDKDFAGAKDLNWQAAIQFIQNCQNLPGTNKRDWVSTDPKDHGGFVYDPDSSKAGAVTNVNGRLALRSYGSISYAGLLSFVYADVKRSDPRVQAVLEWLRNNMTLEENPGMGAQGYYYYLHLMAKALNAAQVDVLETKDGRKTDWRREVAMKLINQQKSDGSWQNENGRWWEKDANLVTSYSVMALEIIHRGM
jgi:squalene-hopene/tetraprenyl-beta-curcumene cyclase